MEEVEVDQFGGGAGFFEESAELIALVHQVVASEGKDAAKVYHRYKAILCKYQEQSQLLDAYLEDVVAPLATLLRVSATQSLDEIAVQRVLSICRLLNVLVVVRGYKTVVKFFPHEAADLERVVHILQLVRSRPVRDSDEGITSWEAQAMLLLWLSILILIPFKLSTLDSKALGGEAEESAPYTALVATIMDMCKDYLKHPGGVREMAAVVLGRLLTRPDMRGALAEFLDWVPVGVAQVDNLHAPFMLPGALQAVCFAFKLGQRNQLLPFAHAAWQLQAVLAASPQLSPGAGAAGGGNVLARKLLVKLRQRIGLTFLAPRLAPWRYVRRDNASLDVTLVGAGGAPAGGGSNDPSNADDDDGDEEMEIVEEVEEVIEGLLAALRDKDTVVRWSGAKGVGRITGCLPRELGDEVVESVMQLFGPMESDAAWHGGCLALAELARRGLLLPARLPPLTPVIRAALAYDVRRGAHSIGAHVRDAAAYVCWAFARAYAPELLQASVCQLAASLLAVACYDREVNCRRAAAAAFQEAVGRLGNVPHGIAILAIADYFSVGITQQAYLRVGPAVAAIGPEYRDALAQQLVEVKARHWDKALRQLAARAAAALVPHHPAYFAGDALDALLPLCLHDTLEVRHGAVVFVAEIIPALHAVDAAAAAGGQPPPHAWLPPQRQAEVAELVPAIDKARLYRGKGGEAMREAVARLVECCSRVGLPMSGQQHAKVQEALGEGVCYPQRYIQVAAVAALRAYSRAYLVRDHVAWASFRSRCVDQYLARLHDPNVAVRRGYALALGALPPQLLQPMMEDVVETLVDGCVAEEDPDERDVESRVNCVRTLGGVAEAVLGGREEGSAPSARGAQLLVELVIPSLVRSLEDYTTDNRGDVGSLVREAAMGVLASCVQLCAACWGPEQQQAQLPGLCSQAMALLLKQAVERIARTRFAAARHARTLLEQPILISYIPAAARVAAALLPDAGLPQAATGNDGSAAAADIDAAYPEADKLAVGEEQEGSGTGAEQADAATSAAAMDDGNGGTLPPSAALLAAMSSATSVEALRRTAQLLDVPAYTAALLEGLVASVGCVDNSLAKAAASALVQAVSASSSASCSPSTPEVSIEAATASSSGAGSALTAVCGELLVLWGRHAKSARMAGPLLRTASLLVTRTDAHAVWLDMEPPPQALAGSAAHATSTSAARSRFVDHLVERARAETRMCSDVGRLLDAVALLCQLVAYGGHCRTSALQGLLVLLASKFPRVRRHAAEQLYLQLLALDGAAAHANTACADAAPLEQVADEASELLLTTVWDGDLEAAKATRDQLSTLVGVPVPKMKAPAGGGAAGGPGGKGAAPQDEYNSYQALLDDFARGY